MSSTVWKAQLKFADVQEVKAPFGAEFLCAKEQFEGICVWFRCDPKFENVPYRIAIVGTGHPAPEDGRYLGTVSLQLGMLMFHVFVQEAK